MSCILPKWLACFLFHEDHGIPFVLYCSNFQIKPQVKRREVVVLEKGDCRIVVVALYAALGGTGLNRLLFHWYGVFGAVGLGIGKASQGRSLKALLASL